MGELRGSDLRIVAEQLGRPPTVPFTVVARCPGGHPLVIRNAPVDEHGDPFPTTFWLTCPDAVRAVSRVEAEGWISRLNERFEAEPEFADAVARAHAEYARERARDDPDAEQHGGVGGTRRGLKCLHAHYAHHLAGGDDVVGAWVATTVEPIHDERPGRVAAVDQGTNSTRLLVAEPEEGGGFEDLARDMVITRLGQGVDETGRLAPDALERTLEVIARYVRRARALHVERIRVGATAAVRDASNADEFERPVRELAGSAPEIVSGDEEARLSFLGATRGPGRARALPGPRHRGRLDRVRPGVGASDRRDLDADGERPADRALRPRRPAGGGRPGPDASGRRRAAGRRRARDPGRRCANVRRGGRDVHDRAGDRARARILRPRTDPPHPPIAGRRREGRPRGWPG